MIIVTPAGSSAEDRNLSELADWPATTGERLGFEASMLDQQRIGIQFLVDDMIAVMSTSKEMKPDWRQRTEQIAEALVALGLMTDELVRDIGGALLEGNLKRTPENTNEQLVEQDPAIINDSA